MEQISKLVWSEPDVPEELHDPLRTIGTEYAVSDSGAGLKLNFRRVDAPETTVRVSRSPGEVLVEYSTVSGRAFCVRTIAGYLLPRARPLEVMYL